MADIDATGYLVIKATRQNWGTPDEETGLRPVHTAKISQARQSRPGRLERDEILVKVTVRIPASVFDPIMPKALIVVPEDLVLARHEVEAVVEDDSSPEDDDFDWVDRHNSGQD